MINSTRRRIISIELTIPRLGLCGLVRFFVFDSNWMWFVVVVSINNMLSSHRSFWIFLLMIQFSQFGGIWSARWLLWLLFECKIEFSTTENRLNRIWQNTGTGGCWNVGTKLMHTIFGILYRLIKNPHQYKSFSFIFRGRNPHVHDTHTTTKISK